MSRLGFLRITCHGSNQQPLDYRTDPLTTELLGLNVKYFMQKLLRTLGIQSILFLLIQHQISSSLPVLNLTPCVNFLFR